MEKRFEAEIQHWDEVGYSKDYDGMEPYEYIAGKIEEYCRMEDFGYSNDPAGFDCMCTDIIRILK